MGLDITVGVKLYVRLEKLFKSRLIGCLLCCCIAVGRLILLLGPSMMESLPVCELYDVKKQKACDERAFEFPLQLIHQRRETLFVF